jgi:hypothetical protein
VHYDKNDIKKNIKSRNKYRRYKNKIKLGHRDDNNTATRRLIKKSGRRENGENE